jgi:hypothetical protein
MVEKKETAGAAAAALPVPVAQDADPVWLSGSYSASMSRPEWEAAERVGVTLRHDDVVSAERKRESKVLREAAV